MSSATIAPAMSQKEKLSLSHGISPSNSNSSNSLTDRRPILPPSASINKRRSFSDLDHSIPVKPMPKSNKLNQLAGKSTSLKVNPIYERVGDYTRDAERRAFDVKLNLLAIAGVFCGVLEMEISWASSTFSDLFNKDEYLGAVIDPESGEAAKMVDMGNPLGAELVKIGGWFFTAFVIKERWRMFSYERQLKEALWNNLVKLDYIWSRSEFTHLIIETAVLLVAPIPFLGPQTTVVSLMFARLYLLFHLLRDFSEVYRNRRDIVVRVFDKVPNPPFNWFQSVQYEIKTSPIRFLGTLTMLLFSVFSYLIYILEREYQPIEYTFQYCLWHTVTVMTTLGFTHTPVTAMGKLCTVLMSITGIFLETLFVVSILENLSLSHYQEVSLNFMEKRGSVDAERSAAVSFVQEVFRFVLYRNRQEKMRSTIRGMALCDTPDVFQAKEKKHQVMQAKLLLQFRQARRFKLLKESSTGDPIMDKMSAMELKVLKEMRTQALTVDKIGEKLRIKLSDDERRTKIGNFGDLMSRVDNNKGLLQALQSRTKKNLYAFKEEEEDTEDTEATDITEYLSISGYVEKQKNEPTLNDAPTKVPPTNPPPTGKRAAASLRLQNEVVALKTAQVRMEEKLDVIVEMLGRMEPAREVRKSVVSERRVAVKEVEDAAVDIEFMAKSKGMSQGEEEEKKSGRKKGLVDGAGDVAADVEFMAKRKGMNYGEEESGFREARKKGLLDKEGDVAADVEFMAKSKGIRYGSGNMLVESSISGLRRKAVGEEVQDVQADVEFMAKSKGIQYGADAKGVESSQTGLRRKAVEEEVQDVQADVEFMAKSEGTKYGAELSPNMAKRRAARKTDHGETAVELEFLAMQKGHELGRGKEEEKEEHGEAAAEKTVAPLNTDTPALTMGKGGGGRKGARVTDAGKTREQLKGIQGEGPAEVSERRDGIGLSASAATPMLEGIGELEGTGPTEGGLRRDARVTDVGATRETLEGFVGQGPIEGADRRDGEGGLSASTMGEIGALQGQGPTEEGGRRDARITDAGATREQLAGVRGTGLQEGDEIYNED